MLREAEESDIAQLARWRSDPRVLEFYSGRDRPLDAAGVRRHYFSRSDEPVEGGVREYQACIVERNGEPIGFVQFYLLRRKDAAEFGASGQERAFGVDLYIGAPELWSRGLGTQVLEMTRDLLVEERGASHIYADPRSDNLRSVRALEKAGFRRVRRLERHEVFEGMARDCWLMRYP